MSGRRQTGQVVLKRSLTAAEESILQFMSPIDGVIARIKIHADTAPSGGDAVFDVNVNGTSIYSDPGDRITLTDGSTDTESISPLDDAEEGGLAEVGLDDVVAVDLDEVPGSGVGDNLIISIEMDEYGAFRDDSKIVELASQYRKVSVTNVTPSATADMFGDASFLTPQSPPGSFGAIQYLSLTSGGTFGSETLTVRVYLNFPGHFEEQFIDKTFTSSGQETQITGLELYNAMLSDLPLQGFTVHSKSSIPSSTATGGAKLLSSGGGNASA